MNKRKKLGKLSMLTPFRFNKDGRTYVKMPLFGDNGMFCNAFCIETKECAFVMPTVEVLVVNLIVEEI